MTNPNDAVGTNAAYNGRTSVNAFNDSLAVYNTPGILSGWQCNASTGMSVQIGGAGERDVAVAQDATGNRTTVNNRSGSPITVSLSSAPSTNSRIDAIVAYVTNPPSGSSSTVDNPTTCGIIAVSGTTSTSPSAPNDSAIRSAITSDGGSGSTAYYVVLATVRVASGTTDISSDMITAGQGAALGADNIDWATFYRSAPTPAGDITAPASTLTTVQSMTLPAGKWRIIYMIRGYGSGALAQSLVTTYLYSGESAVYTMANNWVVADNIRGQTIGSTELTLDSDTVISSRYQGGMQTTLSNTAFLFAIRIG